MPFGEKATAGALLACRARIDTYQQSVVYLREDCAVCRSEGLESQAQVEVVAGDRVIFAVLHRVAAGWLGMDQVALSEIAWTLLGVDEGTVVVVRHAQPVDSLRFVRAKVYGRKLDYASLRALISDIGLGRVPDIQMAAFVTACAGDHLDDDELIALTRAMVDAGEQIRWALSPVMDKHCIGGLPGNRTTLIVVPIVAACGLIIPKTSSRAITSPAGTADTMETLAPVDLDLAAMRRVVEREGGFIAWGGTSRLSPADDVLIRVERPLELDGEAQLVASVLSKKLAAGSERVVIDVPVGPTAKVRSRAMAEALGRRLTTIGGALGLQVVVLETDGSQPVGRGIGPALEAVDVMAVLQRRADAPADLRDRALAIAGALLELGGRATVGMGARLAADVLDSGRAFAKFVAICEAQGGLREPPRAPFQRDVCAALGGRVGSVDNRRLARAAKLAGAPRNPCAGAVIHVRIGQPVVDGEPLFTLHADAEGELDYALDYVSSQPPIVAID